MKLNTVHCIAWSIVLTIATLSGCVFTVAAAEDEGTSIGIFPRRNATATYRLFKPLAQYLEQQLGVKTKLVIAKDFQHLPWAVSHRMPKPQQQKIQSFVSNLHRTTEGKAYSVAQN